jgi:hypothetical protein
MSRVLSSIGADCSGAGIAGYAIACMAIILSGLFASQVAGPYLDARLDRTVHMLLNPAPSVSAVREPRAGWCQDRAGGCPVRVIAAPIGYPGLGALISGGGPAFLVAASPGGN